MRLIAVLCAVLVSSGVFGAGESEKPTATETIPLRNWMPALWQPAETTESVAGRERISAMALPSAASHFIALSPCRVADTRNADGSHGGPILTGGVSRAFNITTGPCAGIPVAAAYSLNIAVTGSAEGAIHFLAAYPAGTERPLVATMNFDGGETTSNSALVPADALGAIEIYTSTNTHVILDINGYLKEGVVTSVTPGTGLAGGGSGAVTVGIAPGGVTSTQLGASAVTNAAIQDGAVTGAKIANNNVVKSIEGLRDTVDLAGAGGVTIGAAGSTITITAATPPGTMILGQPNDTTILAAGYTELGTAGQLWRPTTLTGAPSGRAGLPFAAVWTGTRMVVWGGGTNTGGQYDPVANLWTATSTAGAPAGRYETAMVWTGSVVIVWGGHDNVNVVNTGGRYNPVADSWQDTNTLGAPAARREHRAVWTGSQMVVWGGHTTMSQSGTTNTGGRYDPVGNAWGPTSTGTDVPTARFRHSLIWTGTQMIVWGGYDGTYANSGARYNPGTDVWTAMSTAGAPEGRQFHAQVWTGTHMIVWGGRNAASSLNSGGRYNPSSNTWLPMSAIGGPSPREQLSAVWSGNRMIIWGGYTQPPTTFFADGFMYEPASDSWTTLTQDGQPSPRCCYGAVWASDRMIIWGGFGPFGTTNTGAVWMFLSLYRKN